ncbi:RNA-dependent RNA polymerase [Flammulina velutipes browning virus]|uniref:RNA-dependent RNA polymerase n=1 Tax=Flammulina velutipes browning virus TaxID=568090 RepID=C0STM0_9VIRU|nr:RNA-dependent RNA polymerase [Flammulina velutipes browning virus]BAH56481.1 RNA-dependent RNA polymerase [Flammulina velutipes browning virus]
MSDTLIDSFSRLTLSVKNFVFLGFTETQNYPQKSDSAILSHRKVVLNAFEKYLNPIEYNHVANEYKRSETDLDSTKAAFFKGDIPDHEVPRDEHYNRAFSVIVSKFRPPEPIRPVHYADLRLYPWPLKPSAEAPFSNDKSLLALLALRNRQGFLPNAKPNFHNLFNWVFGFNRQCVHLIKKGKDNLGPNEYWPAHGFLYPINIHTKSAIIGIHDPNKVRTIFGVPKLTVMVEAMFFWPLFRYYRFEQQSPLLWGYETMLGGWYKLNHELHLNPFYQGSILSLDWSFFDGRALFSVINDLYSDKGVKSYFEFNNGYIPTVDYPDSSTHPQKLHNLWDWMLTALKFAPCALADGTIWQRTVRGIASGQFTTQFMDSIYNGLMILTILSRMGFVIDETLPIKLLGDDSVTRLAVSIPASMHESFLIEFQRLADYYFSHTINVKKSKISNTPHNVSVLSYANNNGLPVRSRTSLLCALLYPKSRRPTWEHLKARAIGVYYASCGIDRTVRLICKDIFDYLDSQGIQASSAGLQDLFDPNFKSGTIPLDVFPSVEQVTTNLRSFHHLDNSDKERYFPTSHFLDTK